MASLIRRRSKETSMSLLQAPSPALLKILMNCLHNLGNAIQLDHRFVEFNDTKYRIRSSEAGCLEISISIPIFSQGQQPISILNLPLAVTEAVKASYGHVMQIIENPEQGFNLTVNIDLSKFPSDKEGRLKLLTKVASLRAFMVGEQTREICSWRRSCSCCQYSLVKQPKLYLRDAFCRNSWKYVTLQGVISHPRFCGPKCPLQRSHQCDLMLQMPMQDFYRLQFILIMLMEISLTELLGVYQAFMNICNLISSDQKASCKI